MTDPDLLSRYKKELATDQFGRIVLETWSDAGNEGTAIFSPCQRYRFSLTRRWSKAPLATFIGLNPSTADARTDDPTIRRCIGFSKSWGCGGIQMLNLFAFRATDPREMKAAREPVGDGNNERIAIACLGEPDDRIVVAAWGVHGVHLDRCFWVDRLVGHLQCLGTTRDGHPRHPLYLPNTAALQPFAYK